MTPLCRSNDWSMQIDAFTVSALWNRSCWVLISQIISSLLCMTIVKSRKVLDILITFGWALYSSFSGPNLWYLWQIKPLSPLGCPKLWPPVSQSFARFCSTRITPWHSFPMVNTEILILLVGSMAQVFNIREKGQNTVIHQRSTFQDDTPTMVAIYSREVLVTAQSNFCRLTCSEILCWQ